MPIPWFFSLGLRRKSQMRLKIAIRRRLNTEDYTCRLPRPKPRVRYKLTIKFIRPRGSFTSRYVYA